MTLPKCKYHTDIERSLFSFHDIISHTYKEGENLIQSSEMGVVSIYRFFTANTKGSLKDEISFQCVFRKSNRVDSEDILFVIND